MVVSVTCSQPEKSDITSENLTQCKLDGTQRAQNWAKRAQNLTQCKLDGTQRAQNWAKRAQNLTQWKLDGTKRALIVIA